jgi:hypothetical protein
MVVMDTTPDVWESFRELSLRRYLAPLRSSLVGFLVDRARSRA